MKTKAFKSCLCIVLCLLCLVLTGCQVKETDTGEELVKEFLTEYFSFNKNSRAQELNSLAEKDSLEEYGEAYDRYYDAFVVFVTENCIETMKKNREPYIYDKMAAENKLSVVPEVLTEAAGENTYTFEISFVSQEAGELFESPVRGTVTVSQEDDGSIKVNSIVY